MTRHFRIWLATIVVQPVLAANERQFTRIMRRQMKGRRDFSKEQGYDESPGRATSNMDCLPYSPLFVFIRGSLFRRFPIPSRIGVTSREFGHPRMTGRERLLNTYEIRALTRGRLWVSPFHASLFIFIGPISVMLRFHARFHAVPFSCSEVHVPYLAGLC